jgi:hypothetical protein
MHLTIDRRKKIRNKKKTCQVKAVLELGNQNTNQIVEEKCQIAPENNNNLQIPTLKHPNKLTIMMNFT